MQTQALPKSVLTCTCPWGPSTLNLANLIQKKVPSPVIFNRQFPTFLINGVGYLTTDRIQTKSS